MRLLVRSIIDMVSGRAHEDCTGVKSRVQVRKVVVYKTKECVEKVGELEEGDVIKVMHVVNEEDEVTCMFHCRRGYVRYWGDGTHDRYNDGSDEGAGCWEKHRVEAEKKERYLNFIEFNESKIVDPWPLMVQAMTKVLMFFYFPYVLNAFQMFFCTSINGEYYLSADLSVGCVGDEYATCRRFSYQDCRMLVLSVPSKSRRPLQNRTRMITCLPTFSSQVQPHVLGFRRHGGALRLLLPVRRRNDPPHIAISRPALYCGPQKCLFASIGKGLNEYFQEIPAFRN